MMRISSKQRGAGNMHRMSYLVERINEGPAALQRDPIDASGKFPPVQPCHLECKRAFPYTCRASQRDMMNSLLQCWSASRLCPLLFFSNRLREQGTQIAQFHFT